jgi:hypothetical protein
LEASGRLSRAAPGGPDRVGLAGPDRVGLAGPDRGAWPPAILNLTVPPGLIATWAGCHRLAAVPRDLLAAVGLAEGGAAEEREAGGPT